MKAILLLPLLLFTLFRLPAQVAINSDGTPPDASAMLEVTSTGSGILIPRMTATQRDAIPSPATGLMVYVTDNNLFHFYNGTAWAAIAVPDGDGSASNELQTLSKSGTNLSLSNGGGTVSIADNDNDPTNELQTISLDGETVRLTNGGSANLGNNDNLVSKWSTENGAIHHNGGAVGIGTIDPETLLHLKSASSGETTGFKLTQGSFSSLLYHDASGDLFLRKQGTANQLVLDNGGNVGIKTNAPGQALDVNGQIRIRGGNPGAGKVLTASDGNGNASWSTPASVQVKTSALTIEEVPFNNDSWQTLGARTDLQNLTNGNRVLIINSFRLKLAGGSGTDKVNFRILASNLTGSGTQTSTETGVLDDLNRDNWMLYSFHRVIDIGQGSGNYRFELEVDLSDTDDSIRIDEHVITAIKL